MVWLFIAIPSKSKIERLLVLMICTARKNMRGGHGIFCFIKPWRVP